MIYKPHHEEETAWVSDGSSRYLLCKGGEGSGKSVAGIVKTLNWLKLGASGIMVSPDLPHFKKSLWQEFRQWCPWKMVVPEQQYRARSYWQPNESFILSFVNGAQLICGGIEEPGSWEGPNVSFAHFDEARRHKSPEALKVLDGRIRIPGPDGEKPQLYLTTTPRKHWLFDYFGPLADDDKFSSFKRDSRVLTLRTQDNEAAGNLSEGYTFQRGQSLTEAEKRVLQDAEWEDIEATDRYLESITLWDSLKEKEELPPLDQYSSLVLAADAGVSNDCFGVVGVSAHPTRKAEDRAVAVRYVRLWTPRGGQALNFNEIMQEILTFCRSYNVLQIAYDPYQLHSMMSDLYREHGVWTKAFNQQAGRGMADKELLDLIKAGLISHDGNTDLRKHLDNADRAISGNDRVIKLVKRSDSLKIDLAVCTAMAVARLRGSFM